MTAGTRPISRCYAYNSTDPTTGPGQPRELTRDDVDTIAGLFGVTPKELFRLAQRAERLTQRTTGNSSCSHRTVVHHMRIATCFDCGATLT